MSAVLMSPLRLSLLLLTLMLGACATQQEQGRTPRQDWRQLLHDEWFASREHLPKLISTDEIFALSPAMSKPLSEALQRNPSASDRMRYLVDTVFGPDFKDFAYVSGLTTSAGITYQQRGGNCLSLSIMTMVMAEALGFNPQMQEVRVPLMWERRGDTDFVNRHVNIIVRHPVNITVNTLDFSRDVVLDFEPHNVSAARAERILSRQQIASMFYNNLGAEAFARKQLDLAYHYYREALFSNPGFDSAWVNLSQLYSRKKEYMAAEQTLKYAAKINPESYVAISSLQKQLLRQGRKEEASKYEQLLADLRETDPYFLLNRAIAAKNNHDYHNAASSLEKAVKMAEGFEVMHRELAAIYTLLGKKVAADEQLQLANNIANNVQADVLSPKQHD